MQSAGCEERCDDGKRGRHPDAGFQATRRAPALFASLDKSQFISASLLTSAPFPAVIKNSHLFNAKYVPFGGDGKAESYSLDEIIYQSKSGKGAHPLPPRMASAAAAVVSAPCV